MEKTRHVGSLMSDDSTVINYTKIHTYDFTTVFPKGIDRAQETKCYIYVTTPLLAICA